MEVSFKRNKVKFLTTMHFVPTFNNINILNNLFYQKIKLDCNFIAVTQYCKKVLTDVFRINPNNVFVIYNGVDKEEVIKKERSDFGFGLGEILILYVGRLERDKGVDVLIDVFADLADQYSNIRLLLVGGGGDFQDMFSIIKKNNSRITFFGQISPKNTHQLYDLCDIGVIPSLIEQCSYVALEMMSHKVPMLVSNINGISEIIRNKECFIPISNKDPVTIDKSMFFYKLEEFVKNKELRLKLGNSALINWNENYRLERMVKETVGIYTALITSANLNSNININ